MECELILVSIDEYWTRIYRDKIKESKVTDLNQVTFFNQGTLKTQYQIAVFV